MDIKNLLMGYFIFFFVSYAGYGIWCSDNIQYLKKSKARKRHFSDSGLEMRACVTGIAGVVLGSLVIVEELQQATFRGELEIAIPSIIVGVLLIVFVMLGRKNFETIDEKIAGLKRSYIPFSLVIFSVLFIQTGVCLLSPN